MSSYDPRQIAKDALVLAAPPAHSGIKSFVSEDGVILLATELESALERAEASEGQDVKISDLEETVQEQADAISALKKKIKTLADEAEHV